MKALLSVYDKSGIVDLARVLANQGWELLSSGGTAREIAAAGLEVTDVAELTGFPAILGHRVVTLHPKIHGGLLADRDDPEHLAEMDAHGIEGIDLVVVNLYPFSSDPSVELIDIGGPAMVRAAAKNHTHVGVVVDPGDYARVGDQIAASGSLDAATRRELAAKAYSVTSAYDAEVAAWMAAGDAGQRDEPAAEDLPERLGLSLVRREILRYGENPHQTGARYSFASGPAGWWEGATQHGGKAMSYLNVYDADAAWRLVHELGDEPAAVVIKHANPCGAAVAADVETAWRKAHEGDPVSAFGGIVAVNRPVSPAMAEGLSEIFTEVLVAPGFEGDALMTLLEKRNLRVLEAPPPSGPGLQVRPIDGGLLVQTPDPVSVDTGDWEVATSVAPTEEQWADIGLAWTLVARVSSNSIVLVAGGQAVGIGAGQQNRRDAGRIACEKAGGRARGGVYASDAFFPFADGLDGAVEAGAAVVVQPGGSVRDEEVIGRAESEGLAMVMTGQRHFRH